MDVLDGNLEIINDLDNQFGKVAFLLDLLVSFLGFLGEIIDDGFAIGLNFCFSLFGNFRVLTVPFLFRDLTYEELKTFHNDLNFAWSQTFPWDDHF